MPRSSRSKPKSKSHRAAPKKPRASANPPSQPRRQRRGPSFLGSVGSALGSSFGLSSVGRAAGDWLSRITGMGAYSVRSNSLMLDGAHGPPVFNPDGSIVVNKREYLGDVSGSTAFTLNAYAINPGFSDSYPWLSGLANLFEQYEILGQIYEFKSTSADSLASTNTALGTVIMATNYDLADPYFVNKVQMEAHQYCTSCAPSKSMIHPIECARDQNILGGLYTRNAAVPSGYDPRFYDKGNFQIATVGMQAAAVIGELWVSYSIKFMKPKLNPAQPSIAVGSAHVTTTPVSGNILGSAVYGPNSNTTLLSSLSGQTVTFAVPGRYLVVLYGTAGTSWTQTTTTAGTASAVPILINSTYADVAAGNGTGFYAHIDVVSVTASGQTFIYSSPAIVGTGTCDLFVCPLQTGLSSRPLLPQSTLRPLLSVNQSDDEKEDTILVEVPRKKVVLRA